MKILSKLVEPYKKESFIILRKARTLAVFNISMLFLMPVFLILLNLGGGRGIFSLLNIVLMLILLAAFMNLFLIKSGRYYMSANVFVFVTLAALSYYALSGQMKYNVGYVLTNYQLLIFIIFSTLFCRKSITLIVTMLVGIIGGYSMYNSPLSEAGASATATINFSFEVVLIGILAFLMQNIIDKSIAKLEEEADNREQYEQTKNLLQSVNETSHRLAETSGMVSQASKTFSDNAQTQAAGAEEITATIEEITAGLESISENADSGQISMTDLIDRIGNLSESISKMESSIKNTIKITSEVTDKITEEEKSLNLMNETMQKINHSSQQMTNIINMINDISDQINLLSLNASIEAARAGDAGRGFAVVADQISKLADETSSSVHEIVELIQTNESEITTGLDRVQKTVDVIESITKSVSSMNEMISVISDQMQEQTSTHEMVREKASDVKNKSEQIQVATAEQKNASNEIVKSVSQISELIQENASAAEEMTGNAEELNEIADNLKKDVNSFVIDAE